MVDADDVQPLPATQRAASIPIRTRLQEPSVAPGTQDAVASEPPAAATKLDEPSASSARQIFIAVMGQTGTGKSTFINQIIGEEIVEVGHTLESCTQSLQFATTIMNGLRVTLIDTPGFDDNTGKDDAQILTLVSMWLSKTHAKRQLLSGVIYLHRITDIRMTGASVRSLTIIKKMCGTRTYENIALATTRWDDLGDPKIGIQREKELKENWWAPIIDRGGGVFRHDKAELSAKKIVADMLPNPSLPLCIQDELQQNGIVGKTTAGIYVDEYLENLAREKGKQIEAMRRDIEELQKERIAVETSLREALQSERRHYDEAESKIRELTKATHMIEQLKEDKRILNMKLEELQVISVAGSTATQRPFLTKMWSMLSRWDERVQPETAAAV